MSCGCTTGAPAAWYLDTTMVLQLGQLKSLGDEIDAPLTDAVTGAVITDATVTGRLEDVAGTAVSGETWPVNLTHVSGGVYRGAVAYAVAVQEGVSYYAEIVAERSGSRSTWRVPVRVQQRVG